MTIPLLLALLILVPPSFSYGTEVREHVVFDRRAGGHESRTAYLAVLGDYSLTGQRYKDMDEQSRKDIDVLLNYLNEKATIIVNFEFPLPASDVFAIDLLRTHNVAGAILANNHACDGGEENLRKTSAQLARRGVEPFGTFEKPYMTIKGNRSNYAIYALTRGLDRPCNGVNTAEGRNHEVFLQGLAKSGPLVVYAHDPGPSVYITDYEEERARHYIELGARLVIMDGSHHMKGARQYGDSLALFGAGNFLLGYREPDDFVSVASIVGFDDNKIVYLSVVPFYDERGKVFRLMQGAEYNDAVRKYQERSVAGSERAYRDASTKHLVAGSLLALLRGKDIDRIKLKHAVIFLRFLYYNYFWFCLVFVLFLGFLVIHTGRFVRKRIIRRGG